MDIIPTAIEMAKQLAKERGLDINYEVEDICKLPHLGKKYNMIVDSFCLQGIVTDTDRESVFSAVRARLKPEGYYLVSSAMFDKDRFSDDRIVDPLTSRFYNRYGPDSVIDPRTGAVYVRLKERPEDYEDAVKIGEDLYLPTRRHLKAPALKAELENAGFRVLYQDDGLGGNIVSVSKGSNATLR
jgi:hypothetical protein